MAELVKTNNFTIIGTVKAVDKRDVTLRNGNLAVSMHVTVESVFNGVPHNYTIELFANSVKADNSANALYKTYVDLANEGIGKRYSISGSLVENRYWNKKRKQIVSSVRLRGQWVNSVTIGAEDKAVFTYSGFVLDNSPVEMKNKEGVVYRYDYRVGQANYKEDNLNVVTLHINPNDTEILNAINRLYKIKDTVEFSGVLDFTEQTTVVESPVAFGKAEPRTYVNHINNIYIQGGSDIIKVEDGGYDTTTINNLVSAWKTSGAELAEAAQAEESAADLAASTAAAAPKITQPQTSLL